MEYKMRPEMLSVRAVNQYRYRDIIAYLGLRYFLDNDCAKRDVWAEDITTHLIQTRNTPVYFRSNHFKEIAKDGTVVHRIIHLPGPNELLAESYLLYYCSTQPAFQAEECVYSYRFPEKSSKESIFKNYFPGFRGRNEFLKKICRDSETKDLKILFADIKKFYPSISSNLAMKAWKNSCEESNAPKKIRNVGEQILSHYQQVAHSSQESLGILTGPMFSHLLANLVLSDLDKEMYQHMNQKYCRYVDDFVLIGTSDEIKQGRNMLKQKLEKLNLVLHDEGKDFEIDASEWLDCEENINENKMGLWNNLIANIKRFLVANPHLKEDLERGFLSEEIRLPLLDYSAAVSESTYLEKLTVLLSRYSWLPNAIRSLSITSLVNDALKVRKEYQRELNILLESGISSSKYERKILVSRLKFYSKRLTYLATPDYLLSCSAKLQSYPELISQSMVMKSIYTKDITELIRLGNDAAQSVAQVLGIQPCQVNCDLTELGEPELQSLAIFRFHEIKLKLNPDLEELTKRDLLNQFSLHLNQRQLMSSGDLFVKELACLRGIDNPITHKTMLNTAFDRNEELSFSIIDQLQDSNYF